MNKDKFSTRVKSFFCGFIPRYINNTVVNSIYSLMGILQRALNMLSPKTGKHNASALHAISSNQAAYHRHNPEIQTKGGFIENQRDYSDMSYGKGTMKASGCGIFAVYNALSFLTDQSAPPPDLPGLIRNFESNGMVLNGYGGTAPGAIRKYLSREGIPNKATSNARKFDSLADESRCLILTMFNDRNDIRRQMHTICVTKQEASDPSEPVPGSPRISYIAHNVSGNGTVIGPYPTFSELMKHMNGGNSKIFFMIGIHDH